ncbi:hypothetical protein EVAR_19178_1 [Eumeta japonica]|uniref:Uncharacterized protein n=1 Tax=Eumeta variegata TaxID=151549 RepID=A0A4C1VPG1_EUMVA|nr:hypothetical protein EVAR_19178_1 [Eumeta japonica]
MTREQCACAGPVAGARPALPYAMPALTDTRLARRPDFTAKIHITGDRIRRFGQEMFRFREHSRVRSPQTDLLKTGLESKKPRKNLEFSKRISHMKMNQHKPPSEHAIVDASIESRVKPSLALSLYTHAGIGDLPSLLHS